MKIEINRILEDLLTAARCTEAIRLFKSELEPLGESHARLVEKKNHFQVTLDALEQRKGRLEKRIGSSESIRRTWPASPERRKEVIVGMKLICRLYNFDRQLRKYIESGLLIVKCDIQVLEMRMKFLKTLCREIEKRRTFLTTYKKCIEV